ncbi:MAG TPA: hypothetical protein PL055_02225, partial [Methanobacterium sp.]|nr:hypothetical protein [Methanobacterium sp.]
MFELELLVVRFSKGIILVNIANTANAAIKTINEITTIDLTDFFDLLGSFKSSDFFPKNRLYSKLPPHSIQ